MNTQTIPSRMNFGPVPEFVGGLWFADVRGVRAFMERDEIEAIERSGKCSVESYAHDDAPALSLPTAMDKLATMEHRPGAIERGVRPVHIEQVPRFREITRPAPKETQWHLLDRRNVGGYAACGGKADRSDVFGFARFGRMRSHRKVCKACYYIWREEFGDPDGRRMKSI